MRKSGSLAYEWEPIARLRLRQANRRAKRVVGIKYKVGVLLDSTSRLERLEKTLIEEDEAMEDSSEFTDFTQIPPNERKLFGKRCPAIARREIYGMLAIFLIMGVAHVRCSRDAYRWVQMGTCGAEKWAARKS
eukprot:1045562-Prorocentrum_minimum.AAC.1